MKTPTDSQKGIDRFAVIRHYEPTRIERELLAHVFEIVSHRSEHDAGQVDTGSAARVLCSSQVADDSKSPSRLTPMGAVGRNSMEPAA